MWRWTFVLALAELVSGPAEGATKRNPPLELAGIALGSKLSALEARCREADVFGCKRTIRKAAGGLRVVRQKLQFRQRQGSTMRAAIASAKDDIIVAVRGYYRERDRKRAATLAKAFGKGEAAGHVLGWTFSETGTTVTIAASGAWVEIAAPATAKTRGLTMAPIAIPPATPPLLPAPPTEPPAGGVKIPVRITLDALQVYDENDATSVFHGDDPYIKVVALHTSPELPVPWESVKRFSDMEDDKASAVKPIGMEVLDEKRRFVGEGEAVALHVSLYEGDTVSYDDEIDFIYVVLDYPLLQGLLKQASPWRKTVEGTFRTLGTRYALRFTLDVGKPVADTRSRTSAYRSVRAASYAGSYDLGVGDFESSVTLRYAAPTTEHPQGSLSGTLGQGRGTMSITTERLFGASVVLRFQSRGGTTRLFGYLGGTAATPIIAGTSLADGKIGGFYLRRRSP